MDESQEVVIAEVSAPEQVATAVPEAEDFAPEAVEPAEAPKTFSQEELDAAIGKRLAREQRKWEREQNAKRAEMQTRAIPAEIPSVDSFNSPEEYAEVLAERKAEELLARRDQARAQSELLESYHDKEEDGDRYDEVDGIFWSVCGVWELTKAGKKMEKYISRKFWTNFG